MPHPSHRRTEPTRTAAALGLVVALVAAGAAAAPAVQPAESAPGMTAEQFEASLNYQRGKVVLPNQAATLNLPASFRYLDPKDAERVLVEAWGNPPDQQTLGMLFPADVGPTSPDSWGIVITYSDDGHVADDDADKIDYGAMLKDLQEAIAEANPERVKQGYGAMQLVGWAEAPHYDKASHKFYWAKRLKFDGNDEDTLNYNIRVLGREGVLVLNAVAGINQLAAVKKATPEVLAFTDFNPGYRYSDFNASTDKVAGYGLAALVAGGVAAKLGLFGKLLALLLAFKKFVIIGAVALGALLIKLFLRKKAGAAGSP